MLSLKNLIIIQTPKKILNKFKNYPLLLKNDINDIVWKVYKYSYEWDDQNMSYNFIYDNNEVIICFYSTDGVAESEFNFPIQYINQILNYINKN